MSSDDNRSAPDVRWRSAGSGMAGMQFLCGRCRLPSSQVGSTTRMIRGARLKVCKGCGEKIDAARAAKDQPCG